MTEEADRMREQPEEWLDVCDEQGNPTGERVLRSAAHRDGTPHRTAHVWLIRRRPAGGFDVLLQKRSREKDAFPGCYDISSAGHIPAGDGFVESALRELEEELGIRAEPSELVRIGLCDTRVDTEFHGCPFRNREISAVFVCEKPVQRSDFHLQREEVEEVCRIACVDEFLERLPEGYDTEMGQGGVNVSGGQKQRICIARALLKKPKVLILDDSTSAVDTATERKIRERLAEYLPFMTKIIIAQRISSVRDADQIVILDDGKISDIGTHEELLARSEIYQQIYDSQKEGVEL